MALPQRLWLPEPAVDSSVGAPALLRSASLPFTGVSFGVGLAPGTAALPPSWTQTGGEATRMRLRALWRGEAGLPDRPVLVDWFPISHLDGERTAAVRVRGLCHAGLLALLDLGVADARTAYAVSEATDGVDLATVARAARGELAPWWCVQVSALLCRTLLALTEQQRRRGLPLQGHGRLLPSTVFVGWNGSVHLLAYSPSPGSSRSDDLVAPELRASERLLSPAADVYAVAALLRLLLPPAAAARPAISRLLRRCLHAQADQRMSLSTLHNALGTLLLDLGAPLRRAAAIGEVLGRFCPRAAVDLLEADWGESTGEGFPSLPPSLAPLSATTVALSPTWFRASSPPAVVVTPRRRWAARGLALLPLFLVGLAWLFWPARPKLPRTMPAPKTAPKATTTAAITGSPPLDTAADASGSAPPQRPLWSGLRVDLQPAHSGGEFPSTRSPRRVHVQLTNPGRTPLRVRVQDLHIRDAHGVLTPVTNPPTPADQPRVDAVNPSADLWVPAMAPTVTVGPGRVLRLDLAFVPTLSDTAALSATQNSPTPTQQPSNLPVRHADPSR